MQESIYTVWKNGEYVGEGSARQMAELTGKSERSVRVYATPSYQKANKKWYAERIVGKFDLFADYAEVDYRRIQLEMAKLGTTVTDMAEIFGIKYAPAWNRLNKKTRFRYGELEELEDLFFLDKGTLIKGGVSGDEQS